MLKVGSEFCSSSCKCCVGACTEFPYVVLPHDPNILETLVNKLPLCFGTVLCPE